MQANFKEIGSEVATGLHWFWKGSNFWHLSFRFHRKRAISWQALDSRLVNKDEPISNPHTLRIKHSL